MKSGDYAHSERTGVLSRVRSAFAALFEPRARVLPSYAPSSDELAELFGHGATPSGVWVSDRVAMQIGTVYACVRNIADDVSKCSIVVGERADDGGRRIIRTHPIHRLLNVESNPEMTAKVFRETIIAHAVLTGNGYAEIQWLGNGLPGALWPLDPAKMRVIRESSGAPLRYVYEGRDVGAENVLHIPGLGYDGRVGYSVVAMARDALGSVIATERFGASFFANGARPSGTLTHPGHLSDKAYANLRRSFEERYQGSGNAGKPLILEEGMKWESMSIPPEDAQFLATRQFQVPEICRWFRMPPHKVADLSRATFANIEHQSIEYVTDCLLGWFIRFEQEVGRKIFGASSRMYIHHNANSLLRGDAKTRYEAYGVGRQWGWFSANDIRRLEDMDPIGDDGDVYLVPLNMRSAAEAAAPTDRSESSRREARVGVAEMAGVFREQAESAFRSFGAVLRDKESRCRDDQSFERLRGEFVPRHTEHVRSVLGRIGEQIASAATLACGVSAAAARAAAAAATHEAVEHHVGALTDRDGWCVVRHSLEASEFVSSFVRHCTAQEAQT